MSSQQGAQQMSGMQGGQSVASQQEVSGVSGVQSAGLGSQSQSVPSLFVAPTEDPIRGMLVEFISLSVAKEQLFEIFVMMFTEYGTVPTEWTWPQIVSFMVERLIQSKRTAEYLSKAVELISGVTFSLSWKPELASRARWYSQHQGMCLFWGQGMKE